MKKFLVVLLSALIMCATLTACGEKQGDTSSQVSSDSAAQGEEEKDKAMEKASKLHTQMLKDRKFDELLELVTAEVKAQLPSGSLDKAWDAVTANLGEVNSISEETEKIKNAGTPTIYINKIEYSTMVVPVLISYDDGGLISGLRMNIYELPSDLQDTDSYKQEAIKIGGYELLGILTTPKNVEKPPVVVMLQGSGSSNFDEGISVNKPFKDISIALAEKGIASIRYNKRYYQYPYMATPQVKLEDEYMQDVSAAVAFGKEKFGDNVFFLGHSLGGMSAPKIALDNPQIKGIISLAGSPRELVDIIYSQNINSLATMDLPKSQKTELLADVKKQTDAVKALTTDDGSAPLGMPACYWLSLRTLDTLNISKQLEIPMLIMQGGADFQVSPKDDFELWKKELAGKDNATFKLYDNLNHLFMQSINKGKFDMTEYDTRGTVENQVTDDIAVWIGQNMSTDPLKSSQ